MRVAIINLTAGGMSGGYRAYLRAILPRLAAHESVKEIFCVAPVTLGVENWFKGLSKTSFFSCTPFRPLWPFPDRALLQAVKNFNPDIIFIPLGRYVYFGDVPIVMMVQNMGPLISHVRHNPLSEKIRYFVQKHTTKFALKKADGIVAPSNFVRDFLVHDWKIPDARVVTIYYGVPSVSDVVARKPAAVPGEWQGKFVFTAGSIEPYRGLEDLLVAMEQVRRSENISGLVIAGDVRKNMAKYHTVLKTWAQNQGLQDKIIWTGMLSSEEMAWCYRNSKLFVMTSRVESFAMIGVEAMAYGCVCIIANNHPLPEIFSDAAQHYPSGDVDTLADLMINMSAFALEERAKIQARAQKRSRDFSWGDNVNKLVALLHKVSNSHLRHQDNTR